MPRSKAGGVPDLPPWHPAFLTPRRDLTAQRLDTAPNSNEKRGCPDKTQYHFKRHNNIRDKTTVLEYQFQPLDLGIVMAVNNSPRLEIQLYWDFVFGIVFSGKYEMICPTMLLLLNTAFKLA